MRASIALFLIALALPLSARGDTADGDRSEETTQTKKTAAVEPPPTPIDLPEAPAELAVFVLSEAMRGNVAVVEVGVAEGLVQHGARAADGRQGLLDMIAQLPSGTSYRSCRVLVDGPLVAIHGEYVIEGTKKAAFDVFRIEGGRLVEHWQIMQDQPETTVSGRTMLDGPTDVDPDSDTESNRAVVRGLIVDVFIGGQRLKALKAIASRNYAQHNPLAGDNLGGLLKALRDQRRAGTPMRYGALHQLIADGDFALAMGEGTVGAAPTVFFDLFRLEDGKIVEHWDVIAPMPRQLPHGNGVF
jgi:predicted SnoaL-like aldol condensation-catalyzing enzyme